MTDQPTGATRREFIAIGGAAAAAAAVSGPGAASGAVPQPEPEKEAREITTHTLAEAEKLASLELTEAEREQALDDLESQIDRLRKRREHHLANADGPATVFDPMLGAARPGQATSRVRLGDRDATPLPRRDEDIAFAAVTRLAGWIESGQLSAERLTRIYVDRLKRIGPKLECVVTLTEERALAQARAADDEISRGHYRGPLHGIPWGAKDLFDTAGIRTTWGAAPYKERVAEQDAVVVRRLDEAGAVMVAKLSLGALAYGDIWYGGRTNNPFNLEQGSSGSSAGSAAAVAAGLVGFALGTE
ncbi:MAG: amidase family protein, partial [Planctomycetota bacterium]